MSISLNEKSTGEALFKALMLTAINGAQYEDFEYSDPVALEGNPNTEITLTHKQTRKVHKVRYNRIDIGKLGISIDDVYRFLTLPIHHGVQVPDITTILPIVFKELNAVYGQDLVLDREPKTNKQYGYSVPLRWFKIIAKPESKLVTGKALLEVRYSSNWGSLEPKAYISNGKIDINKTYINAKLAVNTEAHSDDYDFSEEIKNYIHDILPGEWDRCYRFKTTTTNAKIKEARTVEITIETIDENPDFTGELTVRLFAWDGRKIDFNTQYPESIGEYVMDLRDDLHNGVFHTIQYKIEEKISVTPDDYEILLDEGIGDFSDFLNDQRPIIEVPIVAKDGSNLVQGRTKFILRRKVTAVESVDRFEEFTNPNSYGEITVDYNSPEKDHSKAIIAYMQEQHNAVRGRDYFLEGWKGNTLDWVFGSPDEAATFRQTFWIRPLSTAQVPLEFKPIYVRINVAGKERPKPFPLMAFGGYAPTDEINLRLDVDKDDLIDRVRMVMKAGFDAEEGIDYSIQPNRAKPQDFSEPANFGIRVTASLSSTKLSGEVTIWAHAIPVESEQGGYDPRKDSLIGIKEMVHNSSGVRDISYSRDNAKSISMMSIIDSRSYEAEINRDYYIPVAHKPLNMYPGGTTGIPVLAIAKGDHEKITGYGEYLLEVTGAPERPSGKISFVTHQDVAETMTLYREDLPDDWEILPYVKRLMDNLYNISDEDYDITVAGQPVADNKYPMSQMRTRETSDTLDFLFTAKPTSKRLAQGGIVRVTFYPGKYPGGPAPYMVGVPT